MGFLHLNFIARAYQRHFVATKHLRALLLPHSEGMEAQCGCIAWTIPQ